MVNVSIDVTDLGGEARPGDKVVFWRPRMGGSATHAGRVISTAPVTVFLTDGKATVSDVEPGEMTVLLQCRGVESQGPVTVGVPDGDHTVTLRALLESQFEYAPPIVSAVQEAASNASASEEAAIRAQVRSEAAADRADAKVDDAINNGANLIRDEVKQDADRAVSARQAATQAESNAAASESAAAQSESNAATSETNAKQSEDNAGDYAAVATTAATEAVDAMTVASDAASSIGDSVSRAAASADSASQSETNAAQYESRAAAHEQNALSAADRIGTAEQIGDWAQQANDSALAAGQAKDDAVAAAGLAEEQATLAIAEWEENVAEKQYAKYTPVGVRLASDLGVSPSDADAGQTITEALNSLPDGATLYLDGEYTASTSIVITKPVRIIGPAKITAQHDNPIFDVQSDNVSFDGGLRLVGKPHESYIALARGISCLGTLESPRHNIHIGRVTMESFAGGGLVCRFVKNLTTSEGLEISNARYYGIGLGSCDTVKLVKPVIRNITPMSASNPNCYGITATHSDGTPELEPSSSNVTIEEALIEDVPTWVGIDTHGGKKITVLRPTIRRCLWGISLVSGPGEDGSEQRAPLDFLIDSPRIEDCSSYGIGISGASTGLGVWAELATGVIQNPTLVRCGNPESNNSGAIWLRSTKGVRVLGVRAFEPGSHGVCLQYNNFDFHIEDAVVVDPWSNTHTLPSVIAQRSSWNTGTIESFRGLLGGKQATNVLKFGLHSGTATETSINLGTACTVDAGILAYEAGSGKRLAFESQASVIKLGRWQSEMGFYGATPVAQPSVSGSATDQATTQALVNEIRANLVSLGLFK